MLTSDFICFLTKCLATCAGSIFSSKTLLSDSIVSTSSLSTLNFICHRNPWRPRYSICRSKEYKIDQLVRHHSLVVALAFGAGGPGFKIWLWDMSNISFRDWKTLSVHPAVNGYLALFTAIGKVKSWASAAAFVTSRVHITGSLRYLRLIGCYTKF